MTISRRWAAFRQCLAELERFRKPSRSTRRSDMTCKHVKNHILKATTLLLAAGISAVGQNFPTVITTVAGGGSSENVPATTTAVAPAAVVVDSAGNLFIADFRNNRIRKVDTGGIITTVAGNGAASFSGDGGPATSASLNFPRGVAIDGAGNILIADTSNHRVRKVDHVTQIITTVAGSGTRGFGGDGGAATLASLNSPGGLAVDSSGNLVIADFGNFRIRKVDHGTQVITTVAGSGSGAFSGDGGPATSAGMETAGVAVDSAGNFFIADFANNRVRKVDTGGTITTFAGNGTGAFSGDGGPATSASLFFPRGVTLDGAGNLLIADSNNFRIRRVDGSGTITTVAGNGNPSFSGDGGPATSAGIAPDGVALDAAGNLFSTDMGPITPGDNRVRRIDHSTQIITTVAGNGNASFLGDGGPATKASLQAPQSAALDAAGNIFITDSNNNRIRKVDSTGVITTVAGSDSTGFSGDGGPATSATLSTPAGIALDAAGTGILFIADTQNQRIRKVDLSGTITTVAGNGTNAFSGDGGPATSASLNFPEGVAVDSSGNIFIADTSNNRIRKVDAGGIITTVAGNGNFGFSGDGGSAINASLAGPDGVALDSAGNLFIADTSNQRIRKVDHATQNITTVAGNGNFGFSGDNGPATSASLSNPFAVAVDSAGNLLISDFGGQRVRKVDSSGVITTIAGNGTASFSGDGGSAASSGLSSPAGLAVDRLGNFFIADSGNNRVRRVVTPPDFAIATNPATASIRAGQSATFTFTVTPGGGFNSAVSFSCSGLPALSTCTFTPASVTPNGNPVTVTLAVKTTGPSTALQAPALPGQKSQPLFAFWTLGGPLGMMGLILAGTSGKNKRGWSGRPPAVALLGAVLLVVLLTVLGCGGGNSTPPQTPAGTSTVVVTAASGSTSHAANLTLTVTQ
jgi:sugar lactone lactonase YvrE